MRLLVVSPFLPSEHPRHGGEKLLFEMLQHLSRRHEVALAAFVQPDVPPGVIGRMKTLLPVVETVRKDVFHLPRTRRARNLFSLTPARFLQTASPEMESRIRRLVETFDPHTVQVEFLAMAGMGSRIPHPVVVLDSHEAFGRAWSCGAMARGPGPGACLQLWEAVRLMRMEAKVLGRFRTVLAFSREDRDFFLSRSPNASVHIWTPGVNLPPPRTEVRTPAGRNPGCSSWVLSGTPPMWRGSGTSAGRCFPSSSGSIRVCCWTWWVPTPRRPSGSWRPPAFAYTVT